MDNSSLLRLMTWLSPGYPVGAYSYSHGLENAVECEKIANTDDAYDWLRGILCYGSGQSDIVLLNHAYQAIKAGNDDALYKCAEFADAFCGTLELSLETRAQGRAFLEITQKSWPSQALDMLVRVWPEQPAYPVVVGVAAAGHDIGMEETTAAYLHAFAANLISALVRLVPLGQSEGQILMARLEPVIIKTAHQASLLSLEQISNSCMMIEMSSMQHETQYTRIFRS